MWEKFESISLSGADGLLGNTLGTEKFVSGQFVFIYFVS